MFDFLGNSVFSILKELDSNNNTEWVTTFVREKGKAIPTTTTKNITTKTPTTTTITTITTITTTPTITTPTTTATTTTTAIIPSKTTTATTTTIATTTKTTEICNNHGSHVFSLAFNSQGLLASGSDDKTIKLWEKESIRCIKTLRGHELTVFALAFNSNGLLASGSFDKIVKLWDTKTGECIGSLIGHSGSVTSVAFNSDGLLASGSFDMTIKLWNTTSGRIRTLSTNTAVSSITFISEIRIAYAFFEEKITNDNLKYATGIKTWNIETTEIDDLQNITNSDEFFSFVAFSSNGLLAGSIGKTVILFDKFNNYQPINLTASFVGSEHTEVVNSVAFNNNGLLASSSDDNTIKIWNTTTKELVNTLEGHTTGVLVVAFNGDGLLVSGSVGGKIKQWNIETSKCVKTF
jgi:WD40 repeat protein